MQQVVWSPILRTSRLANHSHILSPLFGRGFRCGFCRGFFCGFFCGCFGPWISLWFFRWVFSTSVVDFSFAVFHDPVDFLVDFFSRPLWIYPAGVENVAF